MNYTMTPKQLTRVLFYGAYRFQSVFNEPAWFKKLIEENISVGALAKEILDCIKSKEYYCRCDKYYDRVTEEMCAEFVEFLKKNNEIHEYSKENTGLDKEFVYNPEIPSNGVYFRRVVMLNDDYPAHVIKVLAHSDRTSVICLLANSPDQVFCQTLFDMREKENGITFSAKACSKLDVNSYSKFLESFVNTADAVFRFFEKDSTANI